MPSKTYKCEIDFRPMTQYKGRPCEQERRRWNDGIDFAINKLRTELDAADVRDAIVETWHEREDYTLSGRPRTGATPTRPEIQVWFKLGDRPICVPSARFASWIDNIKAVAMTLERQRLIRDYGCFTIEEQFAAFAALPAGGAGDRIAGIGDSLTACAQLLLSVAKVTDITPATLLEDAENFAMVFKKASQKAHPDKGGSEEMMAHVNRARDTIKAARHQ